MSAQAGNRGLRLINIPRNHKQINITPPPSHSSRSTAEECDRNGAGREGSPHDFGNLPSLIPLGTEEVYQNGVQEVVSVDAEDMGPSENPLRDQAVVREDSESIQT